MHAEFCNWRTVMTRSRLQIILEVPIERTKEVLETLGTPRPDQTIWVGVAVLNPESPPLRRQGDKLEKTEPEDPLLAAEAEAEARQEHGGAAVRGRARKRSCIYAKDRRFQKWCGATSEEGARAFIQAAIGGSRSKIATSDAVYAAFLRLDAAYLEQTGQRAEAR